MSLAPPLVDLHHHFVPAPVLDGLRRRAGGRDRLVADGISMILSPALADVDAHLEVMAAAGVERAVLAYSGLSVLGPDVCAVLNEGVAAVCAAEPHRFVGAAHVDPAAPERALAELDRCAAELGFPFVALPCSGPGWALDDPSLDAFWARVEELRTPVVLHPALLPAGAATDYGIERCCARPADTVEAVVRVLNHVLAHWPTVRVVAPHLGGAAVLLKGRIAAFFRAEPLRGGHHYRGRTVAERRGTADDRAFAERWAQLYFDTAGTAGWAPPLTYATEVVGADHLVFGSDYPLEAHSAATYAELAAMVRELPVPAADLERIAHGTADSLGAGTLGHPPAMAGSAGRRRP